MPTFDFTFTVRAPLVAVADFHRDTRALKRLTPPPIFMQLHKVEPMAEGSISDFTLWFGPVPLRWVAVHSNVDPQRGFTDTQARGPLKRWRHTHSFTAESSDVTRVKEHIEYEHHGGVRGLFTRLMFGRLGLLALFTARKFVTRRALEKR